MTLPADIYSGATAIYGGMAAPAVGYRFETEPTFTDGSGAPWAAQIGRPLIVNLHGSSGSNSSNGRQYRVPTSGEMTIPGVTEFGFSTVAATQSVGGVSSYIVRLRVIDKWRINGSDRESMHIGFLLDDGRIHLASEHRYDATMKWAQQNLTQYDLKKCVLEGGSMGAWGTISFGLRRYDMFAALYPDRPRWRYGFSVGTVSVATLSGFVSYPVASAPMLSDEDGGGSYADYVDMIAYIANPANKIRPILWCCGRNDGYATFDDQIAAVDALRARGLAFAFAWNDGDHGGGSIMGQLTDSYPYGTFELGRGWPVFTEHSLDKDPRVDLVGEINGGLSFKNMVETAAGWSCEVTSLRGACSVKVKPASEVFTANVVPQLVSIPAANTWVLVQFSA